MSASCPAARLALALALTPFALGLLSPLSLNVPVPVSRVAGRAATPLMAEEGKCVITCSKCKASYTVESDVLGLGAGKRVQCTNCDNEWFQSVSRLSTLPEDMELVECAAPALAPARCPSAAATGAAAGARASCLCRV